MNKIFLIFFAFLLISVGTVFAYDQTIVESDVTLIYNPSGNCTTTCTNTTSGGNLTEHCNEICFGTLKIEGENLLKEIEIGASSFTSVLENNFIRTFGNASDITGLLEEMKKWREYESKYNRCLDSNRNFSTELLMLREDKGYKANFTDCDTSKISLQSRLENKNSELVEKDEELENLKTSKFTWIGLGVIIGALLIKLVLPYLKGRNTPKDESEKGFPPNAGY